jgi:hypothetical protein
MAAGSRMTGPAWPTTMNTMSLWTTAATSKPPACTAPAPSICICISFLLY